MNSRIRDLKLKLLVHDEDRDAIGRIQQRVHQDLVVAVIEAMERALHGRFRPEVIIRVRELSVQWSLAQGQISDRDYTRILGEELAEQLAAQIVRQPAEHRLRPPASEAVVLFENIAHLRASRLSDESESKAQAWFHDGFLAKSDPWTEACAAGPEELKAVFSFLERMGTLTAVLTRLDDTQVRAVAAVLAPIDWPTAALRAMGLRAIEVASFREAALQIPRLSPPGLRFETNELPSTPTPTAGSGHSRPESSLASGLDDRLPPSRNAEEAAGGESGAGNEATDGRNLEMQGLRSEKLLDGEWIPPGRDRAVSTISGNADEMAPRVSARPQVAQEPGPEFARMAGLLETQFGGLFYLLNPILELDLAEILWCAGVKEGEFLCHTTRLILGEEGKTDPAPQILGGVQRDQDPILAPLPAWAEAEIRRKSLSSLGGLLVRRQAPAVFVEKLEERIEVLAGELTFPSSQHIPDPETARVVRHCAAVVRWAFGGRLREVLDRPAFLKLLRIPGWIEPGPEEIRIHLPLDSVDIRVRRAGLDFNPGYLPWLRRKVSLAFEESDRAHASGTSRTG